MIDGTDKFVYPGLVNTHHHFFQTFVLNLTTIDYPRMTVPEWLDTGLFFVSSGAVSAPLVFWSATNRDPNAEDAGGSIRAGTAALIGGGAAAQYRNPLPAIRQRVSAHFI